MATRKLLLWFGRGRKSKTLNLAQQEMVKAIDTVSELYSALVAFSKGERIEGETSIKRLFYQEVEIDNLRRLVLEELTKGKLPVKYREDLKSLVELLDRMADHVKDSARSIKILLTTDTKVPVEISNEYLKMTKSLKDCSTTLGECIEMLGRDPLGSIELAKKVDLLEEEIDDQYVKIKKLLINYPGDVNKAVLLELMDLMTYIENAADLCADTSQYIKVLATGEMLVP